MQCSKNFHEMELGFDLNKAVAEADRCLLCYDAPCSKACPGDTDPGTFIRKLRFKNITGAIRTIKKNNVLGGTCGILCPSENLCEKACTAKLKSEFNNIGSDNAIAIGKIQRFLVEYGWETGFKPLKSGKPRKEKIAVIGSGPAGLSCAATLAQHGFKVTIFEARAKPGGVLYYGIMPYRFNKSFLNKELKDIKELGIKIKCNTPIKKDKGIEKLLEQGFSSVFIGIGLWQSKSFHEKFDKKISGLYPSVDYLSKICDGQFKTIEKQVKDKTVAVIGGGAVAMECAEASINLGAKDVYLVYRRSYLQMPAEKKEKIRILDAGVHFILLNQPIDYLIGQDKKIQGLQLNRTLLGKVDKKGQQSPELIPKAKWNLKADIVIEAIGNKPDSNNYKLYPNVKINDKKLIINKKNTMTSVKGIFAGGDIVQGPSLVVKAVQDGKNAALDIINYLS